MSDWKDAKYAAKPDWNTNGNPSSYLSNLIAAGDKLEAELATLRATVCTHARRELCHVCYAEDEPAKPPESPRCTGCNKPLKEAFSEYCPRCANHLCP